MVSLTRRSKTTQGNYIDTFTIIGQGYDAVEVDRFGLSQNLSF